MFANNLVVNGWKFSHTTKGGTKVYKHESGHEALERFDREGKSRGVRVLDAKGNLIGSSRTIVEEMRRWSKTK